MGQNTSKKVQEEIGERLDAALNEPCVSPRHLGMLHRIQKAATAAEVVGTASAVLFLEGFGSSVEAAVSSQFRDLPVSEVLKRKDRDGLDPYDSGYACVPEGMFHRGLSKYTGKLGTGF